jgi:hypothetical protein
MATEYRGYTIKIRPSSGGVKAAIYRGRKFVQSVHGPTSKRAEFRARQWVDKQLNGNGD